VLDAATLSTAAMVAAEAAVTKVFFIAHLQLLECPVCFLPQRFGFFLLRGAARMRTTLNGHSSLAMAHKLLGLRR
jgi:hypothetical protein